MLSQDQLRRAADDTGFSPDSLEKVWQLVRLLNTLCSHPYLAPRLALKGGTALNLFIFQVPRLSVDIDLNYIGAPDLETMEAERPRIEQALQQVTGRMGLSTQRTPTEHAGGKWRLSYTSVLGRPAVLEVDLNFLLRITLWGPTKLDSHTVLDERAQSILLLDEHELAAGKLAALLARGASRDLFDSRELLKQGRLDMERLRLAFVVYGGINRVDWRKVSPRDVHKTTEEVVSQLLPMLRGDVRPAQEELEPWANTLVDETRQLLGRLLPLRDAEMVFLDRLNRDGEIHPELLTDDGQLQERIRLNPGLRRKALNVRERRS